MMTKHRIRRENGFETNRKRISRCGCERSSRMRENLNRNGDEFGHSDGSYQVYLWLPKLDAYLNAMTEQKKSIDRRYPLN